MQTNLGLCINSNRLYINLHINISLHIDISIYMLFYLHMRINTGLISISLYKMTTNLCQIALFLRFEMIINILPNTS